MQYNYIVYKTTNLINGKYYIGKHRQTSDEFDGYLGSGKLIKTAILKYGTHNFLRETIETFTDETQCYLAEARILGNKWKCRLTCYNLGPGGDCGMAENKQTWWDNNPGKRGERSIDWIENNPSCTVEGKHRISAANKNRIWSEESKKKCGDVSRGKPKPKTECPYCKRMIPNHMFNRYHNNNCKEKI